MDKHQDVLRMVDNLVLPGKIEFLGNKIAELIEAHSKIQATLDGGFILNENQQRLKDTIDHSEVASGHTIHVKLYGETGTGKSWGVIKCIVDEMLKCPGIQALCVRRTMDGIKQSTLKDVEEFLQKWDIPIKSWKKSPPFEIVLFNGSKFIFTSDISLTGVKDNKAAGLGSTA